MRRIALLSFNTAGTLGHKTLLTRLANTFVDNSEVHVVSESEYKSYSFEKNPNIIWSRLQQYPALKTNGGSIDHPAKEEIFAYCKEHEIDTVVYSTFFDPALVTKLSHEGIRNIYLTYPLRDTYANLFFLRGYNQLFTNVIVLKDIPADSYPEKVTRCNPLFIKNEVVNQEKPNILITCGGGGRPSSETFTEIIKLYSNELLKEIPNANITFIKGPNSKDVNIEGVSIISSTDKMLSYIDNSRIVISEAGYFTVHELISRRKPSILIPGDRRIDNQELRAIEYEKKGLGLCVMPSEKVAQLVDDSIRLLTDANQYRTIQTRNHQYYNQYNNKENLENMLRGILT